jgi:hypothetical protein
MKGKRQVKKRPAQGIPEPAMMIKEHGNQFRESG